MTARFMRLVLPVMPLLLLLWGCAADIPFSATGGEREMVIRLDLADVSSGPLSRAASDWQDYKNPVPPGELMQTVRVIIVDGDGVVEHNRRYPLGGISSFTSDPVKVKSSDTKRVWLVVNEDDLIVMEGSGNIPASDYLNRFLPGTFGEDAAFSDIAVPYEANAESWQKASRKLPMAAFTTADVGEPGAVDPVVATVDIHRAAVKYTFRVTNASPEPVRLDGVHLGPVADREYLFPNSAVYGVAPDGTPLATEYAVPADTKTYDFSKTDYALNLPAGMKNFMELPPLYFPEGKRLDTDSVYWATLRVNGVDLERKPLGWRYPEDDPGVSRPMRDLPRNSHVVIDALIKDSHTLYMSACVEPYASVELFYPLGLERREDGSIIYRDPDGYLVKEEGYFDNPRQFNYVDALGNDATPVYVTDKDGNLVLKEVRDMEGYILSKNGKPLDNMGEEGYRDDGDADGKNTRVRNHEGYLMDTDGHPIDAEGNKAVRQEVETGDGNKVVVVRSYDGYPLNYDGLLVDKDGNECFRKDGKVYKIKGYKDGVPEADYEIDKNGNPIS